MTVEEDLLCMFGGGQLLFPCLKKRICLFSLIVSSRCIHNTRLAKKIINM